jgi:hypothetical protein
MCKLILILVISTISVCAWSQKNEGIKADLSVVGYSNGVKEYYVNNILPLSYNKYKIMILGFSNMILYQEEVDSCSAGKFFSLTYYDLGKYDIFS